MKHICEQCGTIWDIADNQPDAAKTVLRRCVCGNIGAISTNQTGGRMELEQKEKETEEKFLTVTLKVSTSTGAVAIAGEAGLDMADIILLMRTAEHILLHRRDVQ